VKFERLRLSGFKTFVEPVELSIAPGLTGIVGPNGCGKSNLVEALRWAMGETSSRSLRGAGMEDVIFAGSTTRPARNHAEVSLRLSEPPAELPGDLAGADVLEISRRIVREQGSTYRMNGREVRARDVQILFADAASGARSPSMVRQGQISEIIAAKPQHRRRILEDAAGVAGLHTRRHEAELRLRQAEENLARLADILTQYERQKGDLKRQARQAERFKTLAAAIRDLEIALLAAGYATARQEASEASAACDAALRVEGMAMVTQGEAERARAVAEHEAETARRANGEAGATLARLTSERATLDADLAHARSRLAELAQRRSETERDAEASERLKRDAAEALARLSEERAALEITLGQADAETATLESALAMASAARNAAEQALLAHQQRVAEAGAERRAAEQRRAEAEARAQRLDALKAVLERELATIRAASDDLVQVERLAHALREAEQQREACETTCARAEQALGIARSGEQAARPKLTEAERLAQRLETEARTIRKLVDNSEPGLWTPAVDRITVAPGYEAALAAALGEDLEAAIEPGAPRHWAEVPLQALPALPEGASPLLAQVQAPGALHARLSQIGVVAAEAGEALAAHLKPGQRLVSLAGDLWRWDGFAARSEAPSPAARRMAERNRLADLEQEALAARHKRDLARSALDQALKALRHAQEDDAKAREEQRRAQGQRESAARQLQAARNGSEASRLQLESTRLRLEATAADALEATQHLEAAREALTILPEVSGEEDAHRAARNRLEAARRAEDGARTTLSTRQGQTAAGQSRKATLIRESEDWQQRVARAEAAAAELTARVERLNAEEAGLVDLPDTLAARRLTLIATLEAAGLAARTAGDALAQAETTLRSTHEAARAALHTLAEAKATTARLEALRDTAAQRLSEITRAIEARIEAPVSTLPAPAQARAPAVIEAELLDLRAERDRLGAVNLRAEIELCEIEKEHERLSLERADVEKAIAKLRRAIDTLNTEGRARLRAAFDKVNAAFTRLFTRLFGGGTAQLQLVEADDPLEAGLEILAHPPGKKPQWLSLLSGGEQALTATALIFAVFLTNPSPICVLDEVDAPLDDSNVERLCDLLADMARETATRFLMITHNPISMARMDRLYGVTMVERGVSQVVSVDLQTASLLAEAG
jgi:chromosome segregation protein